MLCKVCKDGLEGMWDPSRSKRLALLKDFIPYYYDLDNEDNNDNDDDDDDKGLHDSGKHALFVAPGRHVLDAHTDTRYFDRSTRTYDLTQANEYVYGHHKDRASFLASKREGCALCSEFSYTDSYDNPKLQNLGYYSVFHITLDQEGTIDKPVMWWLSGQSSTGHELVPHDPKEDNMNYDFGPSNHDSKAWSIMETWMSTCLDSHPRCSMPKTPTSYRPTRLLKLDNPYTIRLVPGTECPPTLQYVALSYCWGQRPVESLLRLLQSTVEDLSREQPVKILPKTFRDAINIAQHFGVNYIWIDRLCIFQDSPEDWKREASTMQDVYRNALFSISALGARDDQDGCFFERDPEKAAPTVVRFKPTEDGEEKAFRHGFEKAWSWRHHFENEPLVQRSWVVQERLLAPRTLYFGSKQVFWECREASCSEMHPQGVRNFKHDDDDANGGTQQAHRNPRHPFLWKQLLDAPDRIPVSDEYEQLFADWNMVADYYASRELTVPSDKLVALSGLANDMKARLQQLRPGPHRYLAGLWEESLMYTLVWNARGAARRALQYRAPSWSWACLDGDLNLHGCKHAEVIYFTSMVSVEMAYLGKEDTGEVDGGTLTLAGPCAMAKISMETRRRHLFGNWRDVQSIQADDGNVLYENDENDENDVHDMANVVISFDTLDDLAEEALLIWVCAHDDGDDMWRGYGLVLALVEEDKYRRLGMAQRWFGDKEEARTFSAGFSQKQMTII